MPPDPSSSAKQKAANEPKAKAPQSASEASLHECTALEEDLAALRAAYEQYFLGIERLPPSRAHEDFKKRLRKLKDSSSRNTAVKFRVQSVNSKYLTYERLWTRTLQEIENGTYKRDVLKAKRRAQKSTGAGAEERKPQGPIDLSEELDEVEDLDAVAQAAAAAVSAKPPVQAVAPGVAPVVPPLAPVVPPLAPVVPPLAPAVAPVVPPVAGAVPFRGTAPLPTVTPAVAPVVPPLAASSGTPPKGLPTITPPVPPVGGTPFRAMPTITPPVPPTPGTPPKGLPTMTPPVPPVGAVAPPPPPGTAPRPPTTPPVRATPPPPPAALQPPPPPGAVRPPPPPGAARPATPPPPPGSTPPRPQAAPATAALSDEKLRTVYDAYVQAKRRCQEDTSKMSYEQVASTLRKQVPELLKQANASAVEFKVVIKDGKAVLKAVPK